MTRDCSKPFYTARIKIDNSDKFLEVAQKLRFFNFMGSPCRSLPYQSDLLGSNVLRLSEQNVFVRKIPKTVMAGDLEHLYRSFGEIISSKVSLNEDFTSRGYGFVCFKDSEAATKAIQCSADKQEAIGIRFAPKSKAD